MKTEPQKEHEWLQQLVGEWTYESECVMGPDQPAERFKGKESVRSLGGLWVLCEGVGEMPGGGTGNLIITIGYDPAKQRFVGTFIGSMMANLWIYDGELDAAGKVLTLNAEGPSFTGNGKMANYQDIIEIKGANHRVLSSQVKGDDGTWTKFMTANYRRK
jgi:hypothetical protein